MATKKTAAHKLALGFAPGVTSIACPKCECPLCLNGPDPRTEGNRMLYGHIAGTGLVGEISYPDNGAYPDDEAATTEHIRQALRDNNATLQCPDCDWRFT